MRFRGLVLAGLGLAMVIAPAAAQRTGDRARLIFTVSGSFVSGAGIWTIPNQPVQDVAPADTFFLNRQVNSSFGASLSGTYFPGDKLGFTADASLIGLGYDDTCRLTAPASSATNQQVCASIDARDRSAAAATISTGAIFRVASREFISPFARVAAGLLFNNVSSVLTSGTANNGAELVIYDDDKRTRVRPAFALGLGATFVLAKAYHLRWEVRDNIVGIETVTGPTVEARLIPPHETKYKSLFTVLIGIDVILERQRGRRY